MRNPLADVIPAKVRLYVYAVVFLASLVFAAWQAAEGNVAVFIGSLVSALATALAGSNVSSGQADDPNLYDGR